MTIIWDFEVRTSRIIKARRTVIIVIVKQKKTAMIREMLRKNTLGKKAEKVRENIKS